VDKLAALRAAVYAAPDDDATRLVLGDYLLERGDPRGELVHVQTKLARMSSQDAAARALYERQYAVLATLGRSPNGVDVRYERGFASAAIEAWYANDDAINYLADEPLLERLTIAQCHRGGDERWTNLARLIETVMDRLRALHVADVYPLVGVDWYVPPEGLALANGELAACAAMFEELPPRPPTLSEVVVDDHVTLPATWRR
jgi:uncharacterized protein (TIGR02996 family)